MNHALIAKNVATLQGVVLISERPVMAIPVPGPTWAVKKV
jgi:hypothetical protein